MTQGRQIHPPMTEIGSFGPKRSPAVTPGAMTGPIEGRAPSCSRHNPANAGHAVAVRCRNAAHAATPASLEALGRCVAVAVQALPVTPRRVTARRANNPGWQDRRFGGQAVTTRLRPWRSVMLWGGLEPSAATKTRDRAGGRAASPKKDARSACRKPNR
jgi:hypothetical protein